MVCADKKNQHAHTYTHSLSRPYHTRLFTSLQQETPALFSYHTSALIHTHTIHPYTLKALHNHIFMTVKPKLQRLCIISSNVRYGFSSMCSGAMLKSNKQPKKAQLLKWITWIMKIFHILRYSAMQWWVSEEQVCRTGKIPLKMILKESL